MFLKLRIIFTILAAACLAVVIPAGALFGTIWFFIFGGGAAVFFLAMLICKQKQEALDPLSKVDNETDFMDDKQETEE